MRKWRQNYQSQYFAWSMGEEVPLCFKVRKIFNFSERCSTNLDTLSMNPAFILRSHFDSSLPHPSMHWCPQVCEYVLQSKIVIMNEEVGCKVPVIPLRQPHYHKHRHISTESPPPPSHSFSSLTKHSFCMWQGWLVNIFFKQQNNISTSEATRWRKFCKILCTRGWKMNIEIYSRFSITWGRFRTPPSFTLFTSVGTY